VRITLKILTVARYRIVTYRCQRSTDRAVDKSRLQLDRRFAAQAPDIAQGYLQLLQGLPRYSPDIFVSGLLRSDSSLELTYALSRAIDTEAFPDGNSRIFDNSVISCFNTASHRTRWLGVFRKESCQFGRFPIRSGTSAGCYCRIRTCLGSHFNSMSPRQLPNYLRSQRKRLALSQSEMAFLLGTQSETKVCRYERFIREPSLEAALAYEVIFQRPIKELFAGRYREIERQVAARAKVMTYRTALRKETAQATRKRGWLTSLAGRITNQS
jgi:transcriptional regulator with XRE-family HTH domain